ncbi:MAG: ATP-binding protein [Muribaculaceae bacterium]|nr:ATP-binding protein [Muribaculaceae bacterium]
MRDLHFDNGNEKDRSSQKETALNTKPKTVLEAFEYIVELADNSNLSDEFFDKAAKHIRYACRRLKLTAMQTVMLALFVDRSEDSSIRISEIANYLGCRTTKILRLSKEIDALEEKHYLVAARSHRSLSYRVPFEVIKAIKDDKPYIYEPTPIKDLSAFFDYFNELMGRKDEGELTHDKLTALTMVALDEIKDTMFAKNLRQYNLDDEDTLLFTFMAHLFVENNDDSIRFHDIDDIYDDEKIPSWVKFQLRERNSVLFTNNLIENVNEDGMARADAFKLTDFAKNELLGELNLINRGKSRRDLIKHETFAEKQLIYNDSEGVQIGELTSILSEERFKGVQERLEKAGMRKGFCCLFYGAPGTGKTETVYQIARLTGRDVMRVDVDKIKSCWVGESEKNIKMLFDRYRNICRDSDLAPILLFNEADAVLGVRMEGAARAVDKMENSIQNIILQEMESLEGIMIATTNLTANLDKAFERRFLYKVRYEKPTEEARAKIWKAMMPDLSDEESRRLAADCDLSGGEIENIVRKHSVEAILSGCDTIDLSALRKLCTTERIGSSHTRIGY